MLVFIYLLAFFITNINGMPNTFSILMLNTDQSADELFLWRFFKETFGNNYNDIDLEFYRYKIFRENINKIKKHNKEFEANRSSYRMGINSFSDKSPKEMQSLFGYRYSSKLESYNIPRHSYRHLIGGVLIPKSVDWRRHHLVTTVKQQGNCGSCWAFSAAGSVEGQLARVKGRLVDVSEQQLVDCSSKYGNNGCSGGIMDNAFEYIKEAGGLESNKDYPYVSGTTGHALDHCRFNRSLSVVSVKGMVDIPTDDEKALMEAVATQGPISIAIHATPSLVNYNRGIFDDPDCSAEEESLNHGVLLVGYGEENGIPFWLIKNNWGLLWGEHGYLRIIRKNNLCGVATMASYPLV